MTLMTRRGLILSVGAGATLAACGNGVGSDGAAKIDARVDATRDFMAANFPEAAALAREASGVLYMPLVTEAGLFFGGAFGRGALRINDVTVDYYSVTQASWGLQVGAQQYAHVLLFMTPTALQDFRSSAGWTAGADLEYAVPSGGLSAGVDTATTIAPVIAFVFGQSGLIAGASLKGNKYTRIIP